MPWKPSETSRRTLGRSRNYRLQADELAALAVLRERIGAVWNGPINDTDVVGAAIIMLERITRGDMVTFKPADLVAALVEEFSPALSTLADETRRELAALTADVLAREGIQANIVPEGGDGPPKLRADVAAELVANALGKAHRAAVPAVASIASREAAKKPASQPQEEPA